MLSQIRKTMVKGSNIMLNFVLPYHCPQISQKPQWFHHEINPFFWNSSYLTKIAYSGQHERKKKTVHHSVNQLTFTSQHRYKFCLPARQALNKLDERPWANLWARPGLSFCEAAVTLSPAWAPHAASPSPWDQHGDTLYRKDPRLQAAQRVSPEYYMQPTPQTPWIAYSSGSSLNATGSWHSVVVTEAIRTAGFNPVHSV